MGNEATKNDLAALEKKINAKIQAVIDSANKALAQETAALSKAVEQLNKNDASHDSTLKAIADAVNNHAKLIDALQKK